MKSRKLREFVNEIQFVNRNPRDNSVLNLLDSVDTNPEIILGTDTFLFRGRIVENSAKINSEDGFWGYGLSDSYVPPREKARDMRANYRYIPYLYCSNDRYMSMIEVRPRLNSSVSISQIRVCEELVILDFTVSNPIKRMSDVKRNLFDDLSELFSKPVTESDDILDYIPTQYIAEYVKNLGYDGIAFQSSLLGGFAPSGKMNIVIFSYEKCKPIGSNVYQVTENYMECQQSDADPLRIDISSPVNEMLEKISRGGSV